MSSAPLPLSIHSLPTSPGFNQHSLSQSDRRDARSPPTDIELAPLANKSALDPSDLCSPPVDGEESPTIMSRSRRTAKTPDDMNNSSSVEYRRKNASVDGGLSSSAQTEALLERESFTLDDDHDANRPASASFFALSRHDQRNFLLLVLLYFLQGVPMGLAMGSVPFLLKSHLSYGEIGVFSLASYPYSMKLLWSPVVDAIWSTRLGRRKSWIIPIQTLSSIMLIWLGTGVEKLMDQASERLYLLTFTFFSLVMLCATQDIAVDGWALTLLAPENLSYASTAQTVGLTAGQFLSFTVFLALNSPDFANRWFRKEPLDVGVFTLGGYLTFWGWTYLVVTIGLAILKKEEKTKNREGLGSVYRTMWRVMKLKNVQTFIIIHLISKIGFQANDAVTNLKLLDKGFSQENLALTVLIDFPFEIALGYYAGKWCSYIPPMKLWMLSFVGRLAAAGIAQVTVYMFPSDGTVDTWYLLVVIAENIISMFTSTVMFVAISAFHAQIADPEIGGTYMTLLATVSNLGGTFPRIFVLKLVDVFTSATCIPPEKPTENFPSSFESFSCSLEGEKHRCIDQGGVCNVQRDGYYVMNIICIVIGIVTYWGYIKPAAYRLSALPLKAWREAGTK